MIKIGDIKNIGTPQIDKLNKDNDNKKVSSKQFSNEIQSLNEQSLKEKLESLLGRIDKQSDKLAKRMDIKEVIVYKKLIKEFLHESVNGMVKYAKEGFLDRRGRHRVQAIIKKVDDELATMTKDVLENESDNLDILKKMEDIRGLILDIYM